TSLENATLFAEMLSLPNDGRYPALQMAAEQRRQKTLEAFATQIQAVASSAPLLMIIEDVHWIDPTSLEVLDRAVEQIASLRALLIMTFRPDFNAPWAGRAHVTTLTINRLARREVELMIDNLAGSHVLPASTRQDIIRRSDGIPLFVEEITKAL